MISSRSSQYFLYLASCLRLCHHFMRMVRSLFLSNGAQCWCFPENTSPVFCIQNRGTRTRLASSDSSISFRLSLRILVSETGHFSNQREFFASFAFFAWCGLRKLYASEAKIQKNNF